MKIVASSCWHFDLKVGGYDPHHDIVEVARMVVDATQTADLFVFLGDLFEHNRPSPRAYAETIRLFNEVGCPMVCIKGNHDEARSYEPDALAPFRSMLFPYEHVFPEIPVVKRISGKTLAFVGHVNDTKARKASMTTSQDMVNKFFDALYLKDGFDENGKQIKEVSAVFTHLDVSGVVEGTENSMGAWGGRLSLPDIAKKLPCPIIAGHIHLRQRINPNIILPGSIIPTDFGDVKADKGFVELEI